MLRQKRCQSFAASAAMFVIGVLAAACSRDPVETPELSPAAAKAQAGQEIAEALCARCHAIGLEGDSTHPEAPPFRTLSEKYPVRLLDEALAEGITVGHPDMPEFEFEADQIDELITYLESVQPK
ncbi:cytochrome c [Hyphomonas sp. WL0036]|uniref:c-type cytochrome n=1 Tax=Hyphomonas sediminis TaxID=2866160 RepID=UPI001C81968C|nr:cytochrome c [Hyphomonas sediminis]MBY9068064.1 cytochrome c [Hyphomonas sediminis]